MNFKVMKNYTTGTSFKGYFNCSYKELLKAFGEPIDSDGEKVSTEWVFLSDDGQVFTIYDYKVTSLYDKSYHSVEEFRSRSTYNWHIGGCGDHSQFIKFLSSKIKPIS